VDVIKAIIERYSVRDFKSDSISKETLEKILEAALQSPSAGNSQPWQIFVAGGAVMEKIKQVYFDRFEREVPNKPEMPGLPMPQWPQAQQDRMKKIISDRQKLLGVNPQNSAELKKYREISGRMFHAPVLVVICMDKALSTFSAFDLGMVSQTILLAARGYGIDSIVSASLVSQPDILRQELAIPDNLVVVIGIALGYQNPAHIINTYRTTRRPLHEVVTFKGI